MLGSIARRITGAWRAETKQHESIVSALQSHARHQPTQVAFRFMPKGTEVEWESTFEQLDNHARRLAGQLCGMGLEGRCVLLAFPTGPDYLIAILGCLYAGVIAVPLDVPRPNREWTRLSSVAQQSGAKFVLTSTEALESRGDLSAGLAALGLSVVEISGDDTAAAPIENLIQPAPDSIAYLQYTSGSTREPKGVIITHGNLAHNLSMLAEIAGTDVRHAGVGWLPFFHDMGLVGTVFLPIWMGFTHAFMPPATFVMSPRKWLQAITDHKATLSPAPNFAYELCTRRIKPDHRVGLDLSSWRVAFNGAERVDPSVQRDFTTAFAPLGFREGSIYPCYGLAEATLIVSGGLRGAQAMTATFSSAAMSRGEAMIDENGSELVSCGQVRGDADVLVVDPETRFERAPGHVGEIWVRSASVAAGYWQNDSATNTRFNAFEAMTGNGPYLRTGDLGFFWNEELFVSGRLEDLIILGGQNIVPDDLELTIESAHPAIRPGGAVAFSVDVQGPRPRVVAVAEILRWDSCHTEIQDALRASVAKRNDTTVDEVVLVRSREIPRTPNGKKRRSACRQAYLTGQLESLNDANRAT